MAIASTSYKSGQSGNPNGRPRGTIAYRDLLTAEDRARIADVAGCTPLQFLLSVMLDKDGAPLSTRLEAAKVAAPYMHRRMPIAVELPNQPTQVDMAKLLALPRAEREQLLSTLTKLGVNLGVGAAPTPGAMPVVEKALAGVMAAHYAAAEAAGRPMSPGLTRAKAKENGRIRHALETTGAAGPNGEPMAPRVIKSQVKKTAAKKAKP
jgi:hypothetical protein